jgi:predicted nicotinamide N-methyase
MIEKSHAALVLAHTSLGAAPLVPEVKLHLAVEDTPLWLATESWLRARDVPPPFWAFAWPGGQALARHLLDAPTAEARVLDLGCGGGLAAIAACLRGATEVRAVDSDPFARAAAQLNARANGVALSLAADIQAEQFHQGLTVLAADVFYDRATSDLFLELLTRARAAGARVLAADPRRPYFPTGKFRLLATYDATTPEGLESKPTLKTDVYEMQ